MAKFYIVKAVHKQTFKELYKFGVTRSSDVLTRFAQTHKEREKYSDFNFTVMVSLYLNTYEEAEKFETDFKTIYSEIPDVNSFCLKESGYYHSGNFTGISEFRLWDKDEINKIIQSFYKYKK